MDLNIDVLGPKGLTPLARYLEKFNELQHLCLRLAPEEKDPMPEDSFISLGRQLKTLEIIENREFSGFPFQGEIHDFVAALAKSFYLNQNPENGPKGELRLCIGYPPKKDVWARLPVTISHLSMVLTEGIKSVNLQETFDYWSDFWDHHRQHVRHLSSLKVCDFFCRFFPEVEGLQLLKTKLMEANLGALRNLSFTGDVPDLLKALLDNKTCKPVKLSLKDMAPDRKNQQK